MEVLCEEHGSGPCDGGVLAYVIEGGRGRIAVLCEAHREAREDVAVRDWGTLAFPAARTAEIVAAYRAYHDARRAFVQRFDEGAACAAADGCCDGGVTSYYFSSGETRALCEAHLRGAPVVCDGGTPISVQYNAEVYERSHDALQECWRVGMAESRVAALAAKR